MNCNCYNNALNSFSFLCSLLTSFRSYVSFDWPSSFLDASFLALLFELLSFAYNLLESIPQHLILLLTPQHSLSFLLIWQLTLKARLTQKHQVHHNATKSFSKVSTPNLTFVPLYKFPYPSGLLQLLRDLFDYLAHEFSCSSFKHQWNLWISYRNS